MAELTQEIIDAIKDKDSIKVLATVDGRGFPHVVAKGSINIDENGQLYWLELIESSVTNRNAIHALWYNTQVAITIISKERKSWQIKGIPVKTLINGAVYEEYYVQTQERNPINDLAAVYYVDIKEVIDQAYPVRKATEDKAHPLYVHLDKLAKKE